MRLTRFADNALRCLIYLARRPDETVRVGEVAEDMAMSEDHLLKVVQRLTELGYVRTVRGRNGGVRLAVPAASISVADVVRTTEENFALVPCFEPRRDACPIALSCALPRALDDALAAFFASLDRYTIADLTPGGPPAPVPTQGCTRGH